MRSRYLVYDSDKAHFVTATIIEWLPVLVSSACCNIIVRSLGYCREQKGLKLYGWVILDNHFHAIVAASDLVGVLRDLKSFTARALIAQLELERRHWLLNQLRYYRAAHKMSEHQVWQEGSHPQAIISDGMMEQKLTYIHNNPLKRGLVASPEHWRYSSAHEWLPGIEPVLRVDPWR